jgi:hypothetical protein
MEFAIADMEFAIGVYASEAGVVWENDSETGDLRGKSGRRSTSAGK